MVTQQTALSADLIIGNVDGDINLTGAYLDSANPGELTVGGTVNAVDIVNVATGENRGLTLGVDANALFPKLSPPVNQNNTTTSTARSGISSTINLMGTDGHALDLPGLNRDVDGLNEVLADPMKEDLDIADIFPETIVQETLSEFGSDVIGDLFVTPVADDPVLNKILQLGAHTFLGCAAGSVTGDCGAGALAHFTGEAGAMLLAEMELSNSDILDGVALLSAATALATDNDADLTMRLSGNAAEHNFLNHREAMERARLEALIRTRQCGDCTEEQQRIDQLNALDEWRDETIWKVCRANPSSAECAGWVSFFQLAQASLSDDTSIPGSWEETLLNQSIKDEYWQNVERLDQYTLVMNNPTAFGTGNAVIQTVGGTVVGAAEITALVFKASVLGDEQALETLYQMAASIPGAIANIPENIEKQLAEAEALEKDNPAKAAEIRAQIAIDIGSVMFGGTAVVRQVVKNTDDLVDGVDLPPNTTRVCSFHGDTQVLTATGYQAIQNIKEGIDQVWARHAQTGEMGWKGVEAQYSNPYPARVSVTIKDTETGEVQTIISNRIHPYFAQLPEHATQAAPSSEGHDYQGKISRGQWVDAQHLKIGYRLLNPDESWAEVAAVQVKEAPLTAYNLTVAGFHTYFVAGTAGAPAVWVHNNCEKMINAVINAAINAGLPKRNGEGKTSGFLFDSNGNKVGEMVVSGRNKYSQDRDLVRGDDRKTM